jgi:uncharacterized membrane protein
MKIASILMILISFFLSGISLETNTDDKQNESDLKKDLEEINLVKKRSKLVSCMGIVRNSLAEGNADLKDFLYNTNLDRSKSFDKIVVAMILNCEKKISDLEMEQTLMPENILSPVANNQNLAKLIKFDKKLLSSEDSLNLIEEESNLLKEMSESSQMDSDFTMQDEEIGFLGFKLSQIGRSSYIFIFIGLFLFVVIIFGGLYILKCKKKETKKDRKKKQS